MSDDELVIEIVEQNRSFPTCDDPLLKAEKMRRTHTRGWHLELADGSLAWIDEIDISHTYLGVLDGIPTADYVQTVIDNATAFARKRLPGPEPVVLQPRCFDPGSPHPIMPALRFVAQIASGKLLDPTACGSWLNFVWFAEIDDQKPLTAFVSEALERIDWDQQASSFDY
jgi:hypothetical protein